MPVALPPRVEQIQPMGAICLRRATTLDDHDGERDARAGKRVRNNPATFQNRPYDAAPTNPLASSLALLPVLNQDTTTILMEGQQAVWNHDEFEDLSINLEAARKTLTKTLMKTKS